MTVVSIAMLLGFAALAVDVGLLYNTKTELQRTADAAALAGAWEFLLDENRVDGNTGAALAVDNSRPAVADMVARNRVLSSTLGIDLNSGTPLYYDPLGRDKDRSPTLLAIGKMGGGKRNLVFECRFLIRHLFP